MGDEYTLNTTGFLISLKSNKYRGIFQPEYTSKKRILNMSFRENSNGGSKRACKRARACKCYHCFLWCKLDIYTVTNI